MRFLGTSIIILIGGQFIKMHVLIANPLLFMLDWWNATCYFGCFLCHSAILLSCQSRKEYDHSLVEKTKEKNTDLKWKPAELTTLMTINWVILMNVNLLLNRKPKQLGETFNLPGWKNSSGCNTTTQRVCCVQFALTDLTFFLFLTRKKHCVPQKTGMSPRISPLSEILDQSLRCHIIISIKGKPSASDYPKCQA